MNHTEGGAMLRGKRPFDRAFVDEMVPHHEGAIAMAMAVLPKTRDPELRKLAEEIRRAQEREIAEMSAFRQREYGGSPPKEATPSAHGEHRHRHHRTVRCLARMVDEDRYCIDVLTQVSAVQAALDKIALGLLDDHTRHCLMNEGRAGGSDEQADELMAAVGRMVSR